jgi:hypothetical protein
LPTALQFPGEAHDTDSSPPSWSGAVWVALAG